MPRNKNYRCDKTIDIETLIERANQDARDYFKEMPQDRQNHAIAVVIQLLDTATDAEEIRFLKKAKEVMTDA